jgi:hypothetical protein
MPGGSGSGGTPAAGSGSSSSTDTSGITDAANQIAAEFKAIAVAQMKASGIIAPADAQKSLVEKDAPG